MKVLRATQAHVPALARLRMALLEETGSPMQPAARAALLAGNERFFQQQVGNPQWQDWVVVEGDEVIAIGALAFLDRPPYPGNPDGKDAYLLNMYTAPAHRGRGAARALLQALLDDARARGVCKVILHATEAGRRIYAPLGFEPSGAYMELVLPPA